MPAFASCTVSAVDACTAGLKAQESGDVSRAIACFEQAVAAAPAQVDVRLLLAFAVAGDRQKARAQQVLADTPMVKSLHAAELRKLADAAVQIGSTDFALRVVQLLIADSPDDADLHSTLGTLLQNTGAMDEAGHVLHKASMRWPQHVPTLLNYARWLVADGSYAAALNGYDRAIALAPSHQAARWHRGMLRLMLGDNAGGWTDCEARRSLPVHTVNVPAGIPAWNGRDAKGKTILLWGEQGLGDQIQGVRFVTLLAERGTTVIVRCAAPLKRLFEGVRGVSRVVAHGEPLPACDFHVPMLSVPHLLKLYEDTLYGSDSYISATPSDVSTEDVSTITRARLGVATRAHATRTRVGVVWAGSAGHINDSNRSLSLAQLSLLVGDAHVEWISLQTGDRANDLSELPALVRRNGVDIDMPAAQVAVGTSSVLTDFVDTAHVLRALDCVVTVDTSVAHLAGALGIPTMVLVPFVPDWRWQLAREDSPWYASVRLLRQSSRGDWNGVIARVHRELSAQVDWGQSRSRPS